MAIDKFEGTYGWLSNFFPSEVKLDGKKYKTVEHAYQAAKTVDVEEREKIRNLNKASDAKKRGRKVTMRDDWEKVKLGIMEQLLRQKFADQNLKKLLLDTGEEQLIEGNWWGDTFWGVCRGEGFNHLGRILMRIRADLKKEAALIST